MRVSVQLLEVVVGELRLSPQLHHTHISPIVTVQVCNGPVLHIPFLSVESLEDHHRQLRGGHSCLPQEVEESYRMGGSFVFQRGKSCLFTVPEEGWATGSSKSELHHRGDGSSWQERVKVAVLNGFHSPPSVYGKCEAWLKIDHGTKANRTLRGKVNVVNDRMDIVAQLTLSVSCQDLGEDVTQHTPALSQSENAGNNQKSGSYIPESVAMHTKQECSKCKDERDFSLSNTAKNKMQNIQHWPVDSNIYSNKAKLEQTFEFYQGLHDSAQSIPNKKDFTPSEIMALRIEETEKLREDNFQQSLKASQFRHESITEPWQPLPIFYTSQNTKAEKLWNEKLQLLDGQMQQEVDYHSKSCPTSKISPNMHTALNTNGVEPTTSSNNHSKKSNTSTSSSPIRSKTTKTNPNKSSALKRPTGWLRSTPIALTHNTIPHPKLNRAHLLRRANLDPQLARQIQAEIDHRVKHRLKQIDEGFKTQLEKIQMGKVRKFHNQKRETVGCQTADDLRDDASKFYSQGSNSEHSEYNHQIQRMNFNTNTSNIKQTYVAKENSTIRNSGIVISNGRSKPKELERNLTFEIDVTGRQKLEVNKNEKYEDDFDVSSQSHTSDKISNQTDQSETSISVVPATTRTSATYSTPSSESLSLSVGQPKQRKSQHRATNMTREAKLRKRGKRERKLTRSDVIREPSQDTALTYTVYDDCSQGIPVSPKIMIQESSERSGFQSAQSSIKVTPDSGHRSAGKTNNTQSSQASKTSEISVEVYKEILKGKQADFLARAGSKLVEPEEHSTTPEEVASVEGSYLSCTEGSVKEEEVEEAENISEVYQVTSRRSNVESDYDGCGSSILSSYSQAQESAPAMTNISVSLGNDIANSSQNLTPQNISVLNSSVAISSAISEISSARHVSELVSHKERPKSIFAYKTKKDSGVSRAEQEVGRTDQEVGKTGQDKVSSSISDISARIAALLVPRRMSVTKMNTDSISSYVPSDLCDTMSSLSNMTQDSG